jgi:hypothetical protein
MLSSGPQMSVTPRSFAGWLAAQGGEVGRVGRIWPKKRFSVFFFVLNFSLNFKFQNFNFEFGFPVLNFQGFHFV